MAASPSAASNGGGTRKSSGGSGVHFQDNSSSSNGGDRAAAAAASPKSSGLQAWGSDAPSALNTATSPAARRTSARKVSEPVVYSPVATPRIVSKGRTTPKAAAASNDGAGGGAGGGAGAGAGAAATSSGAGTTDPGSSRKTPRQRSPTRKKGSSSKSGTRPKSSSAKRPGSKSRRRRRRSKSPMRNLDIDPRTLRDTGAATEGVDGEKRMCYSTKTISYKPLSRSQKQRLYNRPNAGVSCFGKQAVVCKTVPSSAGAYSHAVKARGMVYVSGMIGMEAKGKKVVKVKKPKLRDPPEFMREEDRLAQIADNERRWKKYLHDCLVLETNKACENLHLVLQEAGSSLSHVVQTTVYLTKLTSHATVSKVMSEYFVEDPPARSVIQVKGLRHGAQFQIDCVAVI